MIKSNNQPTYTKLTDYLESMIADGAFKPGDKLPTLRQLAEEFGLKPDTARRGIWVLRDRGLLECHQGAGIYVSGQRRRSGGGEKIGIVITLGVLFSTYVAYALKGIQEAADQLGVTLLIHPQKQSNPQLQARISSVAADCDGLMLIGNYDARGEDLIIPVPGVAMEMHLNYGGALSTVSLDPIRSAELAAEFFRARGIRRVAVWDGASPLHNFRAEQFRLAWRKFGTAKYFKVEECGLEIQDDPEVGLFFTGGTVANRMAELYRRRTGRALIDDFAVLALDGKSFLLPNYEPMHAVMPEWTEAGALALHELLRKIRTPGASSLRIYCDVKLKLAERN